MASAKLHLQDLLDLDKLRNVLQKEINAFECPDMEYGFKCAIEVFAHFFEEADSEFFDGEQFYNFTVRDNTEKYHEYFSKKNPFNFEEKENGMTRTTYQVEACDIDIFPELRMGEFLQFYTLPARRHHDIVNDPEDHDVCENCGEEIDEDFSSFDEEDD